MAASELHFPVDRFALFEKAELFRDVQSAVVERAADMSVIRELAPGQVLFTQGERASAIYIVAEGELRSVRQDAKGREQVLTTERSGAVLAAAPSLENESFYSTAIADLPSQVVCLEARILRSLCHEEPQLLWNLIRITSIRLRRFAEVIETLSLKNVDQRLAQFLLSLCEQTPRTEGHSRVLKLTLTQPEMAVRVGSTREVVCRALAHLQKYGLIHMSSPHDVAVPDIRMLRRFAGIERALIEV